MRYNTLRYTPITTLKQTGQWPLNWYSVTALVPEISRLGKNLVGCEIGAGNGWNLVYLLDSISEISTIYAIDPFIPYREREYIAQDVIDKLKKIFLTNIDPVKDRVTFINKTSDDAVNDIPDSTLDFIYIDGDHANEAVDRDIANYYSKVKPGGLFAVHDYNRIKFPPGWAVELFVSQMKLNPAIVKSCSGDIWYWIKP